MQSTDAVPSPLAGRGKGKGSALRCQRPPSQQVHVQVVDRLTAFLADVEGEPVAALVDVEVASELVGDADHVSQQGTVVDRVELAGGGDVVAGDDQDMDGRAGGDVGDGEDEAVLVEHVDG